jgi:hypothetical protein
MVHRRRREIKKKQRYWGNEEIQSANWRERGGV